MSDITVGSVAVDIVPSTKGFAEKLKSKLSGITVDIGITADGSKVRAQLDELTRPRTATINAEADTAAANARLDEAARPRSASIAADSRGISGLLAGVLLLGPALVPVVAAVAGLSLALGAPLAAAGGGLTIFGLIAGKEISNTNKVAKQIADLKKKADTLVDPKASAAAAAQAKALEGTLTGPQKAFLAAKEALAGAFKSLTDKTGGAIFAPIVSGMKLLGDLMPSLAPIIKSVSTALSGMLDSVGKSAKSGALKGFLDFLGKESGPTLTIFAKTLGNVARGFGGLFKAFAPVGNSLGKGLLGLSAKFAKFGDNAGSNKGLTKFVAYIKETGPKVAKVFGDIIKAVVHLGIALAPFGGIVLAGIGLLAKVISSIPTPVLTVLASVIGTVVLGLKAWAIVQGVLDALLEANPIGLVVLAIAGLVAGLVLAYKHSETFRMIVDKLWAGMKVLGSFIGKVFVGYLRLLAKFWLTMAIVAVGALKMLLQAAFLVFGGILDAAAAGLGWIPGVGDKIKGARDAFKNFGDATIRKLDDVQGKLKDTRTAVSNLGKAKAKPIIDASSIDAANSQLHTLLNNLGKAGQGNLNGLIDPTQILNNPGHKANGGPVRAGQPYIVGEHRPELFVPNQSGRILSHVPKAPSSTSSLSGSTLVLHIAGQRIEGVIEQIADSRVDSATAMNGETDRAL